LLIDEVSISSSISNSQINQNLVLEKSAANNFVFDEFVFNSSTISRRKIEGTVQLENGDNLLTEDNNLFELEPGFDNFLVSNTDFGYTKIAGSSGVAIPVGDNTDRYLDPEIGDTRFNTDRELLETWDGTIWIDSAGTSRFVDEDEYNEILIELTLMFG